ncbi:hypothetical protein DYB25_011174 [Aphanomyces astaci]|uniref:Uncharacterized protein n=1 Tax=Aphanomyces astaci TaxID=112090 RepID=A0A397CA02_APHAT|nr:hypothetical protein DYB36_008037 [Aphanomyces astaci]RHY36909.1 hypothetical protein DYB25_011174 [Aphanomyces astaci]RHY39888.1 hypothetical protein DYB30_006845 [Aphanomyces astaci]RHY60292.1 hypothetical protein DYB38_008831 [Aphanomyces astaci]RHY83969.1 hypothetical protein DYB26_008950 [Aphanomyces astaci]
MTDLATQLAMEQEKNRRLQAEVDRLRKAVAEMKRLRDDKVALGVRFEQEQESMLNRLMRQFKSTSAKQKRLNRGPVAAVAC